MATSGYQTELMLRALEGALSPRALEAIVEHPEVLMDQLGGQQREVSVLLTDVRGFTATCEVLPPATAVAFLNDYLTELTEVVFAHDGVLAKYLGDGIIAFWGAPLDQPDHPMLACRAALRLLERHQEVGETWTARGVAPHGVGIGVNTGTVTVGDLGSRMRPDYSVIGPGINLAAVLESQSQAFGAACVVAEQTLDRIRAQAVVRLLGLARQRHARAPFRFYELLGFVDEPIDPIWHELLPLWQQGMDLYLRKRRFLEAKAVFAGVLGLRPQDGPARRLIEYCERYAEIPPPRDWDGVYVPISTEDRIRQALVRQELGQARKVQDVLLPATLPSWPGQLEIAARYRSARETSGDFYDVVPLLADPLSTRSEVGRLTPLSIAVGDVAGKGIGAALVVAVAQTALRLLPAAITTQHVVQTKIVTTQPARVDHPQAPGEMLRRVGAHLYHRIGRSGFVALAYAVIEPPNTARTAQRVTIANAAQAPVLLCRGGDVCELEPPGPRLPLGVLPDVAYEAGTWDLRTGDVLVFSSDGLAEAPAREGGQWPVGSPLWLRPNEGASCSGLSGWRSRPRTGPQAPAAPRPSPRACGRM